MSKSELTREKLARAEKRRAQMVGNRAESFEAAELWDLDFWQKAGSAARLSALVAIHRDVAAVREPATGTERDLATR